MSRASDASPRLSVRSLLRVLCRAALPLGVLSMVVAGCTTQTITPIPDAAPLPDAGDGGVVDAARPDDAFSFPAPVVEACTAEGMGATLGDSCVENAECDDGCYCNGAERCESGACASGTDPCADTVECTTDVCLEESNRCFHDPQHEVCSDSLACNGAEICDVVAGCSASAPLYCNDESSCTIDTCDDTMGCVFIPRDLDGDGFTDGRCGGDDCDDDPRFGRDIYPGAAENCTNRRDDDCDGSRDYGDVDCVPTNDTCASAELLPGAGTYSGATRSLLRDYALTCRTSTLGHDAVYRFTLTEEQNVNITLSGGGSGAAVTVRAMADCETGPDIRCNSGSAPNVVARSLPPGDYAIIVQTSSGVAFDLTLRLDGATPDPAGDTCSSAIDITSAAGIANAADLLQDVLPSCSSSTYRDAYFYFDLDAVSDVTLTTNNDGSFHYANLTTACADLGTEERCWSGSGTPMQTWRSLPAGRYFVSVSTSRTVGMVTASVDIRAPTPIPPNDRCDGAIMLTNGSSRLDTTIDFADDVRGGTCASTGYVDAFYTFTLSTRQRVLIAVSDADGGSTTFYLTLRDSCGTSSDSSSLFCRSGTSPSIHEVLEPDTYTLVVETPSWTTPSDYYLSMAIFPP